MKLWLKYLIGVVLGIFLAVIFPENSVRGLDFLDFINNLVIHIGRYMLLPVLFFSISTACFNLREEKQILKSGIWIFGVLIASSVLLVLIGLVSSLIVNLDRLPVPYKNDNLNTTLDIGTLITSIFPTSGFEVLLNGAYLLPCFIFAGLAGAGATSDKSASKPAVTLFESLAHVCYSVMSFFTEILSIGFIALMCKWVLNFSVLWKSKIFNSLILMLTVDFFVAALVIYPLILRVLCHDTRPYRVLYASICPVLAAFISGDTNLTLTLNLRHGRESLGIKPNCANVSFPLFSIFGRGGSALVETVSFLLIYKSYSTEDLSLSFILWIAVFAFLLSFALANFPSGGTFFAITIMCAMKGHGLEAGYLLLKDVAPFLCAYAAAFDALTAITGSYIVAVKTKMIHHQEIKKFI